MALSRLRCQVQNQRQCIGVSVRATVSVSESESVLVPPAFHRLQTEPARAPIPALKGGSANAVI